MRHLGFISVRAGRGRRTLLWFALLVWPMLGAGQPPELERIRAASDHDYPPYEFLDQDGQPTGFNVELFREICAVAGLQPEIRLDTWKVSLQRLENGEADVMIGMYYSPERSRKFCFSTPFISVSHAIFVRRGSPVGCMEDLQGRAVIVQQGDIMHDVLLGQRLSVDIVPVNDPVDALRLLAGGRHDCALLGMLPALYLIREYGIPGLTTAGPAIYRTDYCIAGRKGSEILMARLDEGLRILHANGRYRQLHDRWFGAYTSRSAAAMAVRWLLWILVPLGLALLAILAWTRTLRRRIQEATASLRVELTQRQAAEMALQHREEHLRITLDSIGDAVIATDAEGLVARMNPAAQRLTGWPLAEAEGRPLDAVFQIIHAQTRQPLPSPATKALKDGQIVRLGNNTTLIHRNGEEYQISDSAAPIQDAGGEVVGAVLVFRDITAQYRLANELRESERQFQELFNNSISGLAIHEIVLDQQGRPVDYVFIKCNRAFETHTGLKLKDTLGKRATQVYPGIEKTHLIATYGKVALTGEPVSFEIFFEPAQRHFQVTACQVGPRRFAAIFSDISAQKQHETALRENARRLEELLEEKEVLLRELHHRVKNNLAVILSLINLQQNAPGRASGADLLKELSGRIRAMAILHEMLYKSADLNNINLKDYLQNLAASLQESFAGGAGARLRVQAEDMNASMDIAVPCGLIVNELVTNAFKHAFPKQDPRPAGAPPPEITVRAERHDGECLLTVADNGRGFPDGMDWQTASSLGLRLVRMLAQQQLQGAVETDNSAGAAFRIRFKI